MQTIKHIEDVISRRRTLVAIIQDGEIALNNMSRDKQAWVSPVKTNHKIILPLEVIEQALEDQMQLLRLELAAIDKQLDAIGSLMGAAV